MSAAAPARGPSPRLSPNPQNSPLESPGAGSFRERPAAMATTFRATLPPLRAGRRREEDATNRPGPADAPARPAPGRFGRPRTGKRHRPNKHHSAFARAAHATRNKTSSRGAASFAGKSPARRKEKQVRHKGSGMSWRTCGHIMLPVRSKLLRTGVLSLLPHQRKRLAQTLALRRAK